MPEVSCRGAGVSYATYQWPGNVRELRNVAERLVLRCADGLVEVDALPQEIVRGASRQRDRERWPRVAPDRRRPTRCCSSG